MLDVFLEHAFLDGRWGNPIILNNPPIEEGTIWMSFVQSFLQWSHIWLDQKDIFIGQPILDRIRDGVTKESDYVLIILSKYSTVSEWCKLELRMAYEKELTTKRVVVLPIRIDNAEVPIEVKTKKYFQLEINDKDSVNALILQIRSLENL